jgi:mono/diheme cytochrome c family protein
MSTAPDQITTALPVRPEPTARRVPVPVWVFILFFVLLYWGMVYFDRRGAWFDPHVYAPYRSLAEVQQFQPATGGGNLDRGKAVYDNVCALCHNTDGSGKPNQAPPIAGSDWAVGSPNRMIRIPLYGLTGPIQVKGQEWNLAMPAMGAALSEEDLAAVLTYMRQSFGNKASEITADMVKKVKAEVGNRTQPFTAPELMSVPEK